VQALGNEGISRATFAQLALARDSLDALCAWSLAHASGSAADSGARAAACSTDAMLHLCLCADAPTPGIW